MPSSNLNRRIAAGAALVGAVVLFATRGPHDVRDARASTAARRPTLVVGLASAPPMRGPTPPRAAPPPSVADAGVPHATHAAPPAIHEAPSTTGSLARAIEARICPEAARLVCSARERLGCSAGLETDLGIETCAGLLAGACARWASVAYGSSPDDLRVSERAALACLDALERDVELGTTGEALDIECADLSIEPVRIGEACTRGGACIGGECIEGSCVRYARAGEPCDAVPCDVELACVAALCERLVPRLGACDEESECEEAGDVCQDGRCAPRPLGTGGCSYDEECEVGFRCDSRRCVAGSHECTWGDECGRGRVCVGDWAARCAQPRGTGEACRSTLECPHRAVCERGICVGPAVARSGPDGREGDLCDERACADGLGCEWTARRGLCVPGVCGDEDVFTSRGYIEDCH